MQVMPLLGYGHHGPGGREVPNRVFMDLSTWHLIQWLYLPRALSQVQALRVNYTDRLLHERLLRVLQQRDGHRIAHAVEQAKIACSQQDARAAIDLGFVEAGLSAHIAPGDMAAHLGTLLERAVQCARECVRRAGLAGVAPDAIYLTGGSSALWPFQCALQAAFPGVPLLEGDLFGGVAAGLAYSRV